MSDITKFTVTNTGLLYCHGFISPQAGSTIGGRDMSQALSVDVDAVSGIVYSDAHLASVNTGAVPITVSGGSGSYSYRWSHKDNLTGNTKFAINHPHLASPTFSTNMGFGALNNVWEVQVIDDETLLTQKELVWINLIHIVDIGGFG